MRRPSVRHGMWIPLPVRMKYAPWTLWLACSCGVAGRGPSVESRLSVRAQSTEGLPLAGVVLEVDGRRFTSGADGTLTFPLTGKEGERRDIRVACPENYQPSSPRLTVSLRKPSAAQAFHYDVSCIPLRHDVVVAVRAIRGPNLAVLYLGSTIARTNEAGVAHALVNVPAGESFRLTLLSEGEGLLPRNPSYDFPGVERDDIFSISEVFAPIPPPKVSRTRTPKQTKPDDRPQRL